ncbi:MAG TPA: hypothetical protein VF125_08185 [Solirubrobacterales bacterium]
MAESHPHAAAPREKSPGEVLRHPLRVRILAACTERETTVREFAEREGVRRRRAGRHFRILRREGYVEIKRTDRVHGLVRHFYVATKTGFITDAEFAEFAEEEQNRVSVAVVKTFHGRCLSALEAETFDSRDDSHFTWVPRVYDEEGFRAQMKELDRSYKRSKEIEDESLERLKKSGREGIPTTIAFAGFESPREKTEAGSPS